VPKDKFHGSAQNTMACEKLWALVITTVTSSRFGSHFINIRQKALPVVADSWLKDANFGLLCVTPPSLPIYSGNLKPNSCNHANEQHLLKHATKQPRHDKI